MPNVKSRSKRSEQERRGQDADRWYRRCLDILQHIGWGARDSVGFLVAVLATGAILVNALFLQSGPHPAPLLKMTLASVPPADATNAVTVPRPRPVEAPAPKTAAPAAPRPPAEIITDIQHELGRRGFYDGAADGVFGPKTVSAVRDFEQAASLKPDAQPSEALLQSILKSSGDVVKTRTAAAAPARSDAIGELLAPSKRIVDVQRMLAQFGYGQIRPTGFFDAETKSAIEKFERDRGLPVTGQVSDRLIKELASITNRPIN